MQTGLELFYSTLKSIIEVHNNQQLDYWLQTTVGEPQKNRLSTFWYWWTHQQYRNKIEKDLFNHDCIDRKERTPVVWSTKFVFLKNMLITALWLNKICITRQLIRLKWFFACKELFIRRVNVKRLLRLLHWLLYTGLVSFVITNSFELLTFENLQGTQFSIKSRYLYRVLLQPNLAL